MTDEELEAIEARVAAATPGPWQAAEVDRAAVDGTGGEG